MFIWLASYPKSGNTLVRSMLAAYFFSEDGIYDFDQIKNIQQFPNIELFKSFGIDQTNEKEVIKNYISIQEKINNKNSVQFFKTHSSLFNINNNAFTDLNNSLAVIYIVRDPRNVVTSWSNHNSLSLDDACNYLIYQNETVGNPNKTYHGTWDVNFRSWKSFKFQKRYLLIKYEDLIYDKKFFLSKILKFIFKFKKSKSLIDNEKLNNVLVSTTFQKMRDLEIKKGFFEAISEKRSGKKKPFFHLGPRNDWRQLLDEKNRVKIESAFGEEMRELGYL